jgi:hypothetical protein
MYLPALGVISILLTWLAISFILLTISRDLTRSVSHHAARERVNYFIFCILMTIGLALMWVFMYYWFIPTFTLPLLFGVITGIAIILELITTWVPLTEGWKYKVHESCSYAVAALIPFLTLFMVFSPKISTLSLYFCLAMLGVMAFLTYLFVFVKSARRHYLVYQNVYVAAFHISILSMLFFR